MAIPFPIEIIVHHHALGRSNDPVVRLEEMPGQRFGVRIDQAGLTVVPEPSFRIARAIYGNSSFWNYAAMANPPIHIVVNRGRVTLEGVVNTNVERMLARSLASGYGAFAVTNALKTDAEVQAELERMGH